jgi:RNA polymerase sigma-70 factor (ECF subfamily)
MEESVNQRNKLKDLQKGCKSAFSFFYESHRSFLYANIYKWVRCHEISQEIFHDVFMVIWDRREQIDLDKSFKSYLFKIAQNQVMDYFKKIAADRRRLEGFKQNYANNTDLSTENTINYNDTQTYLNQILSKIPKKCREVYVLCKIEGYSHDEASKLLNISAATVNNHIVKASKIVKEHWSSGFYIYILFFLFFQ